MNRYVFITSSLIFLLFLLHPSEAKNKYNITLSQLDSCDVYDISRGHGYAYKSFFHVNSLDNKKIAPNEHLHLKFYVMTGMDAHILLSANDQPRSRDKVYEVVIGAGGNTFSAIRLSMGRLRVATNQEAQLLSLYDPTPIEIVQLKGGNLSIYIPGLKPEPLLSYFDDSPLSINYLSFSTFGSMSAKWFYDCPFDGFNAELEQETHPKTALQRLLANVSANALNKTRPMDVENITFGFQLNAISFQQESFVLNTRLNLEMSWTDSKLSWDPQEYDDIDRVVRSDVEIWSPALMVLNGASRSMLNLRPSFELKLHSNGNVSMQMRNVEFSTWCLNSARNWPNEALSCELLLGLEDLHYETDDSSASVLQLSFDRSQPMEKSVSTLSEWDVREIAVNALTDGNADRYSANGMMQTMSGDVSIEFQIARNNRFYRNVFTVPVLASQTLIILSFLLRGYRRGALLLVVFVIVTLGLMFITKHAPPSYVPNILHVYQDIMRIVTFCYILHVIIMWLEMFPPTAKPKPWMMSIVNSSPLRLLLCMRFADSTEYVAIQEYPWREIAKIANNFSFLAINVIFILIDVVLLPSV